MNIFRTMIGCAALAASTAPAAAAPSPAPREAAGDEKAVRAAIEALQDMDAAKLYADKAYAAKILASAELLSKRNPGDAEARRTLGEIRLLALDALGRHKEALALGRELIASPGASPFAFALAASAAAGSENPAAVVEALEAAAAANLGEGTADLRELIDVDLVDWTFQTFWKAGDKASHRRFAGALLALGWPEPDDFTRHDWYRLYLIEGRLEAGDVAGARKLAKDVVGANVTLRLATAKRYAPLLEPGEDPLPLIEAAAAREDSYTRRRLEAAPGDWKRILARAQALRQRALEEEALALLLPATADLAKVEEGGEDAQWVVNEAVFSLLALGRVDEAVKLMEKLLTLDMQEHPGLINMAINHGSVLNTAGRHREAAQWSEQLDRRAGGFASDFGFMWIWSSAACGHLLAGDKAAAAPWLARLEAKSKENRPAHIRALLCAGDMEGAEALVVERLGGDDADDALAALQDYRLGAPRTAMGRLMEERWTALRARPAVQAAIEKAGRILPLPLSKIYWGDY